MQAVRQVQRSTMHKLLALLVLAGVALAHPPSIPRRCSNYNLFPTWDPSILMGREWIVAASTFSGSVFGWQTEYEMCDAWFTCGVPHCGSCSFVSFLPSNRWTTGGIDGWILVQSSWNSRFERYDYVESLFSRAYNGVDFPVYRCFSKETLDRTFFSYREVMDPNFFKYDSYVDDLSYSVGVLSFCPRRNILILIVCNNFQYLNYVDNYPTVIVLSQVARLNADQKAFVLSELQKNNINPYGVILRDNFGCRPRNLFTPSIYL
ncbi:unnamed protein product [Bemisia tabaci]|uniref:Uncharacterized protein n=1 Tax=Bemisia tabaci TaxID=7038 RepID=A0A9P0CFD4_BEMTA|nr:unnamed protein product [Bemisia tabaci]